MVEVGVIMEILGAKVITDSRIPEGHATILTGNQIIPVQPGVPAEEISDVDIATYEPTGPNKYDGLFMSRLRGYLGYDPREQRFW